MSKRLGRNFSLKTIIIIESSFYCNTSPSTKTTWNCSVARLQQKKKNSEPKPSHYNKNSHYSEKRNTEMEFLGKFAQVNASRILLNDLFFIFNFFRCSFVIFSIKKNMYIYIYISFILVSLRAIISILGPHL